jgi:hypothetical protein
MVCAETGVQAPLVVQAGFHVKGSSHVDGTIDVITIPSTQRIYTSMIIERR